MCQPTCFFFLSPSFPAEPPPARAGEDRSGERVRSSAKQCGIPHTSPYLLSIPAVNPHSTCCKEFGCGDVPGSRRSPGRLHHMKSLGSCSVLTLVDKVGNLYSYNSKIDIKQTQASQKRNIVTIKPKIYPPTIIQAKAIVN